MAKAKSDSTKTKAGKEKIPTPAPEKKTPAVKAAAKATGTAPRATAAEVPKKPAIAKAAPKPEKPATAPAAAIKTPAKAKVATAESKVPAAQKAASAKLKADTPKAKAAAAEKPAPKKTATPKSAAPAKGKKVPAKKPRAASVKKPAAPRAKAAKVAAPAPAPVASVSPAAPPVAPKPPAARPRPSAPAVAQPIQTFERDLPADYGDTKLVALVRDPEWIFLYWEINGDLRKRLRIPLGAHNRPMGLRVYDVTDVHFDGRNAHSFYDIAVNDMAASWYLRIPESNRAYIVDLGLYDDEGNFHLIARSNAVMVPPSGMSWYTDEQWMNVTDEHFAEIYRMSGGLRLSERTGSGQMIRQAGEDVLAELRRQWVGSGMFSGASGAVPKAPDKRKGFWLEVGCDVIVYGATEPDARVTLQGRPIQLSPDGRFHARFSLPDGKIEFPVHAESHDGDETREITPIVVRETH